MSVIPDKLYHMGGVPVDSGGGGLGPRSHIPGQKVCYFVDANNGTAAASGEDWANALSTIQAAVVMANAPKHKTDNVDIYIANGQYNEEVSITSAGTAATDAEELWASGGLNIGKWGTLRLIGGGGHLDGGGGTFLYGTAAATTPVISVGRPNVEIHNFATIKCNVTTQIEAGGWTDTEGISGSAHICMPAVAFVDNFNDDNLLGGAANNCVIKNCRVNGGGLGGCIANVGCNWIYILNCLVEYGTDYGIAIVGSSKGSPCENLVQGCIFHQNTSADILNGNIIIGWIDRCMFMDENPGGGNLVKLGAGAAAQYAWMTNCVFHDEADMSGNTGFDFVNCAAATNVSIINSDDGTTWSDAPDS